MTQQLSGPIVTRRPNLNLKHTVTEKRTRSVQACQALQNQWLSPFTRDQHPHRLLLNTTTSKVQKYRIQNSMKIDLFAGKAGLSPHDEKLR